MFRLFRGDCLQVLPQIESVDLVLTDLPYNITQNSWDSMIPLKPMWSQIQRVNKGATVLFAAPPFDKVLAVSNLKSYRYEWVWKKSKVTNFLNAYKQPMRIVEYILVFYDTVPTYNPQRTPGKPYHGKEAAGRVMENYGRTGRARDKHYTDRLPTNILEYRQPTTTFHPTEKPVDLLTYLIKTYSNPGETVLDMTMGSGSTGVAALNCGRNFIGIELDETYYKIACRRLERAEHGILLKRKDNPKQVSIGDLT